MREAILRWLLGGDAKSWKEMFRIAVKCHEDCGKMLKRCERLFDLYRITSERQIATLEAVSGASDAQLKKKIIEIYGELDK